jgi:hypothetical protein
MGIFKKIGKALGFASLSVAATGGTKTAINIAAKHCGVRLNSDITDLAALGCGLLTAGLVCFSGKKDEKQEEPQPEPEKK